MQHVRAFPASLAELFLVSNYLLLLVGGLVVGGLVVGASVVGASLHVLISVLSNRLISHTCAQFEIGFLILQFSYFQTCSWIGGTIEEPANSGSC